MEKLASIVIPCYNVEKYIDRCLESIVNQTIGIDKLEIIIVNDASTDHTWDKLLDWEKKYPDSIVLIQHEVNKKQGAARNTGLCYVTTPYVGFIDADDWVHISMIERLYQKIVEYNADVVGCDAIHIQSEKEIEPLETKQGVMFDYTNEEGKRALALRGCPGYICGKLFQTSLIQDNQLFFLEDCFYEDVEWKDRLNLCIRNYYQLGEVLYYYYANPLSTTMQNKCSRHFDRFPIQINRVQRYKDVGLFEQYEPEIEFQFIQMFYVNSIYIFMSRCNDFTPAILKFMQTTLKEQFPNYARNYYIEKELCFIEKCLLKTAEMNNLTQADLNELIGGLRKDIEDN